MQAAYRRTSATHRLLPSLDDVAVTKTATPVVVPAEPEAASRSAYGQDKRPNWPVIGALAIVHALVLGALIKYDVIPVTKMVAKPLVVELIETPKMSPPPAEPAEPTPPDVVKPPVVMPEPIVQPPIQTPAPLLATIKPPSVDVVVAAPAKAEGPPAPVTPPDFNADYLNNPAPRYPVESRRMREQGTVTIKVLVTPEGTVQDLRVAESSGHSRLDRAALSAVRGWRFAPAKQAGKPVAAWVIVPIPFILMG